MTSIPNTGIHSHDFVTLRPSDTGFVMQDKLILAARAGLEIDQHCPREYQQILTTCINRGWIRPVATVRRHELTWEHLSK